MTHGVYVEVFRVAFVHGNVKSVAVFVFLNHKKKKKRKIHCDCIIPCSDSTDKLVSPESLEFCVLSKFVVRKLY